MKVIEDFYGEELTGELIPRIFNTPDDQLEVLAERLAYEDRGNPPVHDSIRSATLVEGLLLPNRETATRLASSGLLRRMLVYLDPVVVVDPAALWAESIRPGPHLGFEPMDSARPLGRSLARCLNGIVPLLPLIRQNIVFLVHTPRVSWRDTLPISLNVTTRRMVNETLTPRFGHLMPREYRSTADVYSYIHSRNLLGAMSQAFDPAFTFNELGRQLFAPEFPETAFEDHIDLLPVGARLQHVMAFADFAETHGCVGAATSADMAVFSARENLAAAGLDTAAGWMCSLPLPLIDADIADLVALRLGEESFAEFRTALANVLSHVTAEIQTLDYESAMNHVSDVAAQVMPAALGRLETISSRSRVIGKWLPKGVTIGVKAGLRAVTAGAAELVATPVAAAAGGITSSLTKKHRAEQASSAVAHRMALSLTLGG